MDELAKEQTEKLTKLLTDFENSLAEQEKKAIEHFSKIEQETKELENRLAVLNLHLKVAEKEIS